MDLPQLGPVAVLLLKSGKSVACPETPSVTLYYLYFKDRKLGRSLKRKVATACCLIHVRLENMLH